MTPAIDVLGLGCVAVDELLYVDQYPQADAKVRIVRRERQCGGLTGTALVAAARLGARCEYASSLGDDDLSRFARERLQAEGVSVEHLRFLAGARPAYATIVVDQRRQTRAILYDADGVVGAAADWPSEATLRAARVLLVDHYGLEGVVRAARVAQAAGIPVVADFEAAANEGLLAEAIALVDHPVVSLECARAWTGCRDPREAALALWHPGRHAVVVTCGVDGCWYLGNEDPQRPQHQPAYAVTVVDTTGCGDVFHGAYAAGLAQGLSLPDRIRLASATAALKATQHGGQAGIPTRAAVEEFLSRRPS